MTEPSYPQEFLLCLAFTLKKEGGYVHNAHDPGGSTNKGATQVAFSAWLHKHGRASYDVKEITDADLRAFYFENYWQAAKCSEFSRGGDLCIFDFAVNSGPAHVRGFSYEASIDEICNARLEFLRRLTTYRYFGRGWENRVSACRAEAKRLEQGE